MSLIERYRKLSACDVADALGSQQILNFSLRPLWGTSSLKIVGRAYCVRCPSGDNLMMHAAIHEAPKGSVIVVESEDCDFAVAGGNVCAVAQRNGISGFVIDGVIRDLKEIREMEFPVFARGVAPKPGKKNQLLPINSQIVCGGVKVFPGDIVLADEEGIVVVPFDDAEAVLKKAEQRALKDKTTSLAEWEESHRSRILTRLAELRSQNS